MAGIYLHIPFCKQKCSYCDFHFSTSYQSYRNELISCLIKELDLRKAELHDQKINSVYFGGGTPSLLTERELNQILSEISRIHLLDSDAEITLEANPDDFSKEQVMGWKKAGINRLSIGIQSFDDPDLKWMNRAHEAKQGREAVEMAQEQGITNISIDLIYGLPEMDEKRWEKQLDAAIALKVKHISAYCLTVEDKTALEQLVRKKKIFPANQDLQGAHFEILQERLSHAGFVQYEISNFGLPGFFSRHNSSYWKGDVYQGIGPSAHSYDLKSRSWNISNNSAYIKQLTKHELPSERENLSAKDRFNEALLIGLRTIWGVSLIELAQFLPLNSVFNQKVGELIRLQHAEIKDGQLILTKKGMLFADAIAEKLFQ